MAALMPQMLTANRLRDGDVLYWRTGQWVETLADGEVFADSAAADGALAAAQKYVDDCVVVNPYLFDVRVDDAGIHPLKEREIIRAAGPTVRTDLGKQANDSSAARPAPARRIERPAEMKDVDVSI